MNPLEVRGTIIKRLNEDLVGPHSESDVLEGVRVRPSDVYLTGILWPFGDRMHAADDDGSEADDDADDSPSTSSLVGQQRPCSMGISFCVQQLVGDSPIDLSIRFATYSHELLPIEQGQPAKTRWTRRPFCIEFKGFVLPVNGQRVQLLKAEGLSVKVEIHVRTRSSQSGRLVTITLINRSPVSEGDRNDAESLMLFQTQLHIEPTSTTLIVPRPARPSANDEDEEVGRLLYRNEPEFATGHQCSASWQAAAGIASSIATEWIPSVAVTAFREDGDDVFLPLVKAGAFDAQSLATLDEAEVLRRLMLLPAAYGDWIIQRESEIETLPDELQPVARRNLLTCRHVQERITAGVKAMDGNRRLLQSFQLANAAMALQHTWKNSKKARPLCWRPFQLGFVLLAAESTCSGEALDREILDLLWFPTGGGKTEAYLALIAMLAFHRRSGHETPDNGAGNAAVMRYTLRLLTAQQFERATALILACELVRRGMAPNKLFTGKVGNLPFSIGLWVGGDATPNTFADAMANQGNKGGATAEQIDECPCCQGKVRWYYDKLLESVTPYCESVTCLLGCNFGHWPVFTVDSDIYRERPTLLVGTIDKFALLTTKEDVGKLFGFGTDQSTDLIIQDELHLISGPLGTIAGVYETAFDWLLRKNDRRPKIIGSTATIRRASEQVRALFDRQSCQFPPPGLDYDDSGFAVRDREKAPRVYLGVTTAGRSAKFALQATAGSLLQSAGSNIGISDAERDGYSTLLAYFNSLRELGGAIVQMLDDVPDSIQLYSGRRGETQRKASPPRELTSRVTQKEIIEILSELKIEAGKLGSVDVVMATNMVSVGVDVSRLGMMLMNGQPKTRSEYIQATSRVGRNVFPGLVIAVLNSAKPRDRSHYETFYGWHASLYRDVEATSVTPFASRARDRALHAALVAMIRHGAVCMIKRPDLSRAPDDLLASVVEEIERRVESIDSREKTACSIEIDERLRDWEARAPLSYNNAHQPSKSLLISADLNAQRRASGRLPTVAWPTMNNMRSVEATTRFRMAEVLTSGSSERLRETEKNPNDSSSVTPAPRWRKNND